MTKETKIWWARYVGDYQRKTQHLSLAEHGAYALLLDHYYMGGKLTTNDNQMFRICRAFDVQEQQAVKNVLEQFFTIEGDRYINERAEQELERRAIISENKSNNRRGKVKNQQQMNNKSTTNDIQMVTQSQSQSQSQLKPQPKPKIVFTDLFLQAWNEYPAERRESQKASYPAWQKAITENNVTEQQMLDGVKRYAKKLNGDWTYAKGFKAWLNAGLFLAGSDSKPESKTSSNPNFLTMGK